ncbi:MAG TPA: DUF2877 domain-containing protein [Rectinemataceae bacterium]|nr:DUF2877 domain-containing protein [Rectinemataceae bacterium]
MPTAAMNDAFPAARSIGAALPRGSFDFFVFGVFRTAVNLRLEGSDMVASLMGPSGEGFPGAIALAAEVDFRDLGVAAGAHGRLDDSSLVLEARPRPLRVGLDGARRLAARPVPRIARIGEAFRVVRAELGRIQASLNTELRIDALGDTTQSRTAAAVTIGRAAAGLARDPRDPPAAAIRLLVGTGPGLTPAGDDFLSGYLASAAARPDMGFAILAREAEAAASATNELSASLLRQASRGHFPTALIDLAETLVEDSSPAAVTALRRLCAHGHSSGTDMASGFLFGLGASERPLAEFDDCAFGIGRRRQHAS